MDDLKYWEDVKQQQFPVSYLGWDYWAAPIKSIKVINSKIYILTQRGGDVYHYAGDCKVITDPNVEIKPLTKVTAKTKEHTKMNKLKLFMSEPPLEENQAVELFRTRVEQLIATDDYFVRSFLKPYKNSRNNKFNDVATRRDDMVSYICKKLGLVKGEVIFRKGGRNNALDHFEIVKAKDKYNKNQHFSALTDY